MRKLNKQSLSIPNAAKRLRLPLSKLIILGLLGSSVQACSVSVSGLQTHIKNAVTDSSTWVEKNNSRHVQIDTNLNGNLYMNDAETDIIEFPINSDISIQFDDADGMVELTAQRSSTEDLKVNYKVNGNTTTREQISDKRLQQIWQYFFRKTGVNADIRIQNIINTTGIDGVITEIGEIKSNAITRLYIDELMSNHEVNNTQTLSIIDLAADISSNQNSKKAFFAIFNGKAPLNEDQLRYLLKATNAIESNSNLRNLLEDILESERFKTHREQMYIYVLDAADNIESNSNLSGLLQTYINVVAKTNLDKQTLFKECIKFAGRAIESNSNLTDVYIELLEKELGEAALYTLIETAGEAIESNSSLSKVYLDILDKTLSRNNLLFLIETAGNRIESSSSLAKVLSDAMQHETFDNTFSKQMRAAIEQVGSSSQEKKLYQQLLDKIE